MKRSLRTYLDLHPGTVLKYPEPALCTSTIKCDIGLLQLPCHYSIQYLEWYTISKPLQASQTNHPLPPRFLPHLAQLHSSDVPCSNVCCWSHNPALHQLLVPTMTTFHVQLTTSCGLVHHQCNLELLLLCCSNHVNVPCFTLAPMILLSCPCFCSSTVIRYLRARPHSFDVTNLGMYDALWWAAQVCLECRLLLTQPGHSNNCQAEA